MTNLHLTDREQQTVRAALEEWRKIKADEVAAQIYTQRNEYDILSPAHSLMHTLSILSSITGLPLAHFTNALQQDAKPEPTPEPQPKAEPTQPPDTHI